MRFYSGGHCGAEAVFGQQTEAYGIREVNFAYPGQAVERRRGLTLLGPEALKKGAISMEIVSLRLGRTFSRETEIQKVLQTIFHIVNMGHQIFSIGWIQPDDTVKGGTGWAVELGKWFNRPLSVYDLHRSQWFSWQSGSWQADTPRITHSTFAGTGTRHLKFSGNRAIAELFQRSFDDKPQD
jgi:hypothetical protein